MTDQYPQRRQTDFKNSRRLRKGIYILPSLATVFNIAFGYYALYQTFLGPTEGPEHFDHAARAIGFAILFDGIDGRIARMTNTTSDFGRELDSLADAITFGVAPAVLAWVWGFRSFGTLYGHTFADHVTQFGAITTFAFLVAGVSRLARFNIQTNPKPWNPGRPGKKYFVGMAIPAGAGVIAATVHFFGGASIAKGNEVFAIIWGVIVFCAALLMVSTWRFYSFKDLDFSSRRSFRLIIVIAAVIGLVWLDSQDMLAFIAYGYMLSGIVMGMRFLFRGRRNQPQLTEASETQ
ncbi:MAG TPA: phosphatidylcholine/phosphatidylserine synthase [Terriglobales bacterium]|jgi:CDP-diacylglycerol--serine O-phosphatidyltransferase|nr:phosphatidylcholine/phosphatidylserine synthase [Terriglobales bacterium]